VSIFKACDIRGRYGSELNADVAGPIGRAIGSELAGKTVVVGGDVRPSTEPLKSALIQGLIACGCRVLDLGVLPTPAFYFAKDHLKAPGGVMVTGSHNPPGDNGFKISLGNEAITEAEIERIKQRVERSEFVNGKGSCERMDVIAAYEDFLRSRFRKTGGLKVVVDAGNGCYSQIAPRVLRDRGCEVVELFCEPDGRFPNRSPNPAVASNLKVLCAKVAESEANLGVAYDGDGDRVVFVDERGRVVESDVSLVLFARHYLRKRRGDVVYDIKCSSVVGDETRKAGGTPIMEKSGHAFIRRTLMARNAVLGGEISGHFFFGDLGRDDGLYATLVMLDTVRADGRGLAAMSDSVPRYFITPDLRLPCPPERSGLLVRELEEAFRNEPGCKVNTLDGVRIAWSDGWALARPSVTEPLLTMRFEAHSERRLAEIRQTILARVPALRGLIK
jgi:phosphomannomutase/phosphoglucomutase